MLPSNSFIPCVRGCPIKDRVIGWVRFREVATRVISLCTKVSGSLRYRRIEHIGLNLNFLRSNVSYCEILK